MCYKVGDKVRVVSTTYIDDPSVGNEYVVEEVEGNLLFIRTGVSGCFDRLWGYWEKEVEPVKEEIPKWIKDILEIGKESKEESSVKTYVEVIRLTGMDKAVGLKLGDTVEVSRKTCEYFYINHHGNPEYPMYYDQVRVLEACKSPKEELIDLLENVVSFAYNNQEELEGVLTIKHFTTLLKLKAELGGK